MTPTHSLIIPVYRNEEFVPALLEAVRGIAAQVAGTLEVVFVVDGSPDGSERRLRQSLPAFPVVSQLITLSRNFGAFAAIRVGLEWARGDHIAVMAADLQEPPELIIDFFRTLQGGRDVVVGTRVSREDPWFSKASSRGFWKLYRWLVQPQVPAGGVDVFGVSRTARDALLKLGESGSSLIAQLFWIGFERAEIPYHRRARPHGSSGWTLRKKLGYLLDSVFAFTDLPIKLLTVVGFVGTVAMLVTGVALVAARLAGLVEVQGYTAIMVTILFASSLILFGLGIVGNYVWRAFENTKGRPLGLVRSHHSYPETAAGRDAGS